MLSRLSLRTRLVILVTAVALGAIAVVDVATWRSLRASSYDNLDRELAQVLQSAPPPRIGGGPPDEVPLRRPRQAVPADTWVGVYVEQRDSGFERVEERVAQVGREAPARGGDRDFDPVLSEQRPRIDTDNAAIQRLTASPRTVRAEDGDRSFRVAARRLRGNDVLVAGVPADGVESTLQELVRIELVVSALAALGVLLLAFVTVRSGLRPLEEIANAAAAITGPGGAADSEGGTSTERVPVGEAPDTEVGRLALALNAMLDRIDTSFAAQREVEVRLRRFVADASHELRTPLTSIQGYAELARTKAPEMTPAELERALRNVEDESHHLARLVEDMLLLSRLDQQIPLAVEPCDLAEIAARAVDAARAIEPGRSIDLVAPAPVLVTADPVRVRQVLDNLLANVRVHAGPAAAATVEARSTADGGGELVVHDTGLGLPAGSHDVATDRFWRADDARTRATGGSGLGLAIVSSIAEAHGGSVALEPGTDGRGLRVTVRLPGAA